MANNKKKAPAEKKQESISLVEKAKLMKEIEQKLSPELNQLFKSYCGLSRNPQLSKNLQNPNTDWESVLTKWNEKKKKRRKEKKGRVISNPLTFLTKIRDEVNKDSFDGFQSAIGYCQELLKILEEKQEAKKKAKIDAIKRRMKEDEALLKELEGVKDDKAGE